MALKLFSGSRRKAAGPYGGSTPYGTAAEGYEPAEAESLPDDYLQRCLQAKRFGTVLAARARLAADSGIDAAIAEARREIDERFGLVPDGFAALPQTIREGPGYPEVDVEVAAYRMARHAVTNAEYQYFVDDGGYDELELWPRDLWPQVSEFRDLTGKHGPRYWRGGRHNVRLADHPVVGVCSYEATAYARWAGYRLPTETEWQMAATWRIQSLAHMPRRYPWGDGLDIRRCNVWATGLGATAPVTAFPDGRVPNGVQQLIGNVWEWTASDFEVSDGWGRPVIGDMAMKSIRGGAFDTYLASQAASTFRTGLAALVRAHNVGFRCAADAGLAT